MEYLVPGVIYERSANGLLTTFILDSTNAQTVGAWINKIKYLLDQWPQAKTCLMLHDLRKAGSCAALNLLKEKLITVSKFYPAIETCHALLVVDDLDDIDRQNQPICTNELQIYSFASRRDAIAWLMKQAIG